MMDGFGVDGFRHDHPNHTTIDSACFDLNPYTDTVLTGDLSDNDGDTLTTSYH